MNQPFEFGKNWRSFVDRYLNDERKAEAIKSLETFCNKNMIKDKTFLDIGCGSGLFSYAAWKLGASKVVSFDVDQDSVSCCRTLWEMSGKPSNWEITDGSILDETFCKKLSSFDFVYSWGVLHHTGSMWRAINNAISLINPGGWLYIAIYNKADGIGFYPDGRFGPSSFWLLEKKIYMRLPKILQYFIDYLAIGLMILLYLITFQNPFKKIRSHKNLRGMSWRVDIKDWLGGYPYEYAGVDEIFKFAAEKGLVLRNLKSNNGLLNNEYLFENFGS